MRNAILLAAFCVALPLAAQDSSSSSSSQQSEKPQAPALEKPEMAAPEPDAKADVKKPAAKKPAEAKQPDLAPAKTVEEIIARVNNEIITKSEFEKARAAAEEDAKQECQGKCTPDQLRADIDDRQKNTLRDLIDQSLLVQRGKDMGVNVEPEVIKRLDQLRQQNKIDSMEDLEKAVTAQGSNWEDFKNNIRNGILTQRVISSEVGSHINIGKEEISKYYDEHKKE